MIWTAKLIKHKGENRIAVLFDKNAALINRIKQFEDARWSQKKKVWHLPATPKNRTHFKIIQYANTIPSPEGIKQLKKFTQWLASKRYSPSTIKTYTDSLKSFLTFYRQKAISEITNEDVIVYNNEYILKNNLSSSYQNQIVNAIKLYFKTVRETKMDIERVHHPKKSDYYPMY